MRLIAIIGMICLSFTIHACTKRESLVLPAPQDIYIKPNILVYHPQADDSLDITVLGEAELSNTYTLNKDGFITLPLIGSLYVAGKPVEDIAIIISDKYKEGYLINPFVTVEMVRYPNIELVGAIKKPGSYPYTPLMSVAEALALSEGFTENAYTEIVEIRRATAQSHTENITTKEYGTIESPVFPGDTVIILDKSYHIKQGIE